MSGVSPLGRRLMALLVFSGGAAIAAGALVDWIAARSVRPTGGLRDASIPGLFRWSYEPDGSFLRSFAFTVVICGALVAVGGLIRSGVLAGFFSVVALAAGGLWIALNARHYASVGFSVGDYRAGPWLTLAGGLAGLVGAFFLDGGSEDRILSIDWRS